MAVLSGTEINELMLDRAQANTSTDAPLTSAERLRFLNDAYADVYDISGGRLKRAPSANAWSSAQLATGIATGLLADVQELQQVFATATVPFALTTTTASNVTLTSVALFANVRVGMHISGTGIPADTFVQSVETTSSLTMTQAATDGTATSRTFSPTTGTRLKRVERERIMQLRDSADGFGTYSIPKLYSTIRLDSFGVAADANTLLLDYWPSVTGFYFPIHYTKQFLPLTAIDTTQPEVNDLESRDIALLAAARIAQAIGRFEFVQGIIADISTRTSEMLARKLKAIMDSGQDDAAA